VRYRVRAVVVCDGYASMHSLRVFGGSGHLRNGCEDAGTPMGGSCLAFGRNAADVAIRAVATG